MRKKRQGQLSLFHAFGSNDIGKELFEISMILDADLVKGHRNDTGATVGIPAEADRCSGRMPTGNPI